MMRQTDFAGARNAGASAQQTRVRNRVVRRAKGPPRQKSASLGKQTRYAVDLRGLKRLLKRQGWKNSTEPFRQHGLSRPGRPDHENVVIARRGHLQGSFGGGLAAHL